MQFTLNFSKEQIPELKKVLQLWDFYPGKTQYELLRAKAKNSTITVYASGMVLLQGNEEKELQEIKSFILKKLKPTEEPWIFGIDETGRGEKDGAFVIVGVLGHESDFREYRDSKKLTLKAINSKANQIWHESKLVLARVISAERIDELRNSGKNLNDIEAEAVCQFVAEIKKGKFPKAKIVMDGSPIKGVPKEVEFLVRGDALNPVIAGASIVAKSMREKEPKTIRKTWKNNQ